MPRIAAKQQRTPFPTTHKAELKQTPITKGDQLAMGQQGMPAASIQETAVPTIQNVKLKQPTIMEVDVILRAYEIYLEPGAIPLRGPWLASGRPGTPGKLTEGQHTWRGRHLVADLAAISL